MDIWSSQRVCVGLREMSSLTCWAQQFYCFNPSAMENKKPTKKGETGESIWQSTLRNGMSGTDCHVKSEVKKMGSPLVMTNRSLMLSAEILECLAQPGTCWLAELHCSSRSTLIELCQIALLHPSHILNYSHQPISTWFSLPEFLALGINSDLRPHIIPSKAVVDIDVLFWLLADSLKYILSASSDPILIYAPY